MLTIPRTALKAAVICAAVKATRYYLIGVHLERTASGALHVVSTDGSRLFVGVIPSPECTQAGPWRVTIPLDVAKAASKGKGAVQLLALPDGRYELDGRVFAPVDGVYPDWRLAVPTNPSGERADYNHELLADAQAAVAAWAGIGAAGAYVAMNGTWSALIGAPGVTAWAVVMPLRNKEGLTPPKPYFSAYGA